MEYCVCVDAHLLLAHLNVCNVGNEQAELLKQNNAQGKDEMDSLLGVSLFTIIIPVAKMLKSWMLQQFTLA